MSTVLRLSSFFFFFFNDTATTEIYTLSLHDALPISELRDREFLEWMYFQMASVAHMSELVARKNRLISGMAATPSQGDRKSTRLNSSHQIISYAVFCLKKKKKVSIHMNIISSMR